MTMMLFTTSSECVLLYFRRCAILRADWLKYYSTVWLIALQERNVNPDNWFKTAL